MCLLWENSSNLEKDDIVKKIKEALN